uniref:SXP/RAL-2 family protein Ani s 5-like cation-binding domain-containing protein n=1 Tax=Acrobeloides nanus TaxID=290746 RepID=A0A914E3V2_9BILA
MQTMIVIFLSLPLIILAQQGGYEGFGAQRGRRQSGFGGPGGLGSQRGLRGSPDVPGRPVGTEGSDGFGPHPLPNPFAFLLFNLTDTQREAFLNITKNENLTKSELQSQITNFFSQQSTAVQQAYQNITQTLNAMKTEIDQKLQTCAANLSTEAQAVNNNITSVHKNESLTRRQELEAIRQIMNNTTDAIREELFKVMGPACLGP